MKRIIKPLFASVLVIFIIGGLLFSLVYQPPYRPNIAVEFPFETNFEDDKLVVFFGYAGCPSICPTSLHKLSQVNTNVPFQTLFIELGDSTSIAADQYAKIYHPKNRGLKLNSSHQQSLIERFHVFWSPERKEINRIASHSRHLYLLKREKQQWKLKEIYNRYPPDPTEISQILSKL